MNEELLRTNHLVVRNFLSREWAEELYVDFRDLGRVDSAFKDGYSGPCYFYESPVGGQELLYYMTQKMADHVGARLYTLTCVVITRVPIFHYTMIVLHVRLASAFI